jgi:hypothetical protein
MPHGFPHTQTAEADQTVVRLGDLMLDMPEDTTPQEKSALSSFLMSMLEPAPGFNPIQDIIQSPTPVREAIRQAPFLPMAAAMAVGGGSGKKKVVQAGARRIQSKKTVDKLVETLKRNEEGLWDEFKMSGSTEGTLHGTGIVGKGDIKKTNYSIRSDRAMDEMRHHISVNKPEGMASVDFAKQGDEIFIGTLESFGTKLPEKITKSQRHQWKPLRKRHSIQRQSALQELLGAVAEYANKGDVIHPGSLTSDSFTMITNALRNPNLGFIRGGLKEKFKIVTAEDLKAMAQKGSRPEGWTAEKAREMLEYSKLIGTRRLSTGGDLGYADAFGAVGRKKKELGTAMMRIFAPNKASLGGMEKLLKDIQGVQRQAYKVARRAPSNIDADISDEFLAQLNKSKSAIKKLQDAYWHSAERAHGKRGARKLNEAQSNDIWNFLMEHRAVSEQAEDSILDLLDTKNVFTYKPFAIIKK